MLSFHMYYYRKTYFAKSALSKYIAPEGWCTVQYRVTSDNGITSGDESAQRATSDANLAQVTLYWVVHHSHQGDVLVNTSGMHEI